MSDFERSFLDYLEANQKEEVLDVLKKGVINDEVCQKIEKAAAMIAKQFM